MRHDGADPTPAVRRLQLSRRHRQQSTDNHRSHLPTQGWLRVQKVVKENTCLQIAIIFDVDLLAWLGGVVVSASDL